VISHVENRRSVFCAQRVEAPRRQIRPALGAGLGDGGEAVGAERRVERRQRRIGRDVEIGSGPPPVRRFGGPVPVPPFLPVARVSLVLFY
jgi:hypothetical protein